MTKKTKGNKAGGHTTSVRDFKTLFYRKLTENHLFYEIGKIIATEVEPFELIRKVVASIGKAVNFEDAVVYLVKKDMTSLEPFYNIGPLFTGVELNPIYFDNGAPGGIAATGEPVFIADTALYDSFIHHPDEENKPGSYVGVALMNDNRVVGVMGFSNGRKAAFRVEDFDLLRTVSHLISVGLEKADLFKKTLELARVDELTGLYNYRVLLEKMEEEVRRRVRTGREFSFIMIDIDDFKKINDRFGHLEGSRLLAQMGPLLKTSCRVGSTDVCFRYGGEEFSVLLAETDMAEAEAVAERVRKSIDEFPFTVKVAHPNTKVTVSLGVSTTSPGIETTLAALIHEADLALYRSKATGKNRVTCYSEDIVMPGAKAETAHEKP